VRKGGLISVALPDGDPLSECLGQVKGLHRTYPQDINNHVAYVQPMSLAGNMIIGNCYGTGCTGPKGQHVVIDCGDWLYCLTCDSSLKPEGDLWWRNEKPPVGDNQPGVLSEQSTK
jgi:hypothetical protein